MENQQTANCWALAIFNYFNSIPTQFSHNCTLLVVSSSCKVIKNAFVPAQVTDTALAYSHTYSVTALHCCCQPAATHMMMVVAT